MRRAASGTHVLTDRLARRFLFPKDGFRVSLVLPPSPGCPIAILDPELFWRERPLFDKVRSLVKRSWSPESPELMRSAKAVFMEDIFGSADDLGEVLFDLMREHWQTPALLANLTSDDKKRADALETYTLPTCARFRGIKTSPPLNLRLLLRSPSMCQLVVPMMSKIPVISLQYFVRIHVHFAFNEIRRANHPHADDLISLLYETLFLQQKTATGLIDFASHASLVAQNKKASLIVGAELDAIRCADVLFAYLKASIEKCLALLGHTVLIHVEDKKSHEKRVKALETALPDRARNTPYGNLLMTFVSSSALEDLNSYRSGLLHKKGIAELQPHSYVGVPGDGNPFLKVFETIHEQHAKNSVILLAVLALLTDDLVNRLPPDRVSKRMSNPDPRLMKAMAESMRRREKPTTEEGIG